MSKLEHAGDKRTTSPGFAASQAVKTASSIVAAVFTGTTPLKEDIIFSFASPIAITFFVICRTIS